MGFKITNKLRDYKNVVWKPYSKCPLAGLKHRVDSFSYHIPTHLFSFMSTKDYLSTWSWYNYFRSFSATRCPCDLSFLRHVTLQVAVPFWANTSGFQFWFTPKMSAFLRLWNVPPTMFLKSEKELNSLLIHNYASITQWKCEIRNSFLKVFL